jgi:spore maturation protein SpmA
VLLVVQVAQVEVVPTVVLVVRLQQEIQAELDLVPQAVVVVVLVLLVKIVVLLLAVLEETASYRL